MLIFTSNANVGKHDYIKKCVSLKHSNLFP